MSGKYSPYEIFSDWVELMALAIQNTCQMIHDTVWKDREDTYKIVASRYNDAEFKQIAKMTSLLIQAYEYDMTDVLGEIFMESGCASKVTGQFFTPFHLSYLAAQAAVPPDAGVTEKLTVYEPSVGGGGMVIAVAKVLKERGLNYQRCMEVTAQDLDWKSVCMAYVQFSWLGIRATCVQGDTLMKPYQERTTEPSRILRTPAKMGALL
jgi:type I restriction-modification system DNA methylase subunit